MKTVFNKSWKASKQPRKQRKYRYNAPLHILGKFMAATLSKELRAKYGVRNIEVRKGDEVKVMRGKFTKKTGKVGKVETGRTRIAIDGIQTTKKGGDKIDIWFHPSNVKITKLNLDDPKRMKRNKKAQTAKAAPKEEPKKESDKSIKEEKENAPKKK